MRYGKIRIEEGIIHFSSRMITNSVPCSDLVWAYHRRGPATEESSIRTLVSHFLVLVTNRGKRMECSMSEREIQECLQTIQALNPRIATGFPAGSRLLLQTLPNTRDLGAIETADGKQILPGRLLCSGELYHLSGIDLDDLKQEYHLRAIIDLRTPKEVKTRPDDEIEGVSYVNYPLLDVDSNFIFDELTLLDQIGSLEGDPRDYIAAQYKAMIRDPYTVGELARVIETFRKYDGGAILWHSNLGKDRTSLVTAILLEILGVPRGTILRDFQKSNLYLAMEKEYALEFMVSSGFDRENTRPKVNALFEVEERYLEGVFTAIDEEYGSMQRFLKRALYLTPKTIEDLKEMYLI